MTRFSRTASFKTTLGAAVLGLLALPALADQIFNDNVIVDGSLCVGFDCVNGETFGADTIRLKEFNTRIKFQDISTGDPFPGVDWQLTANESTSGGANKFSIDDIDNARTPFTVTAGARSNSIFVNSAGRVGFGTALPAVDLHVVDGDTPTLRLEQDGSSGFGLQTWDVAGNEAGFFIRDATNGSTLPFRIQRAAPSNSIYVASDGNIGIGKELPDAPLEVAATESFVFMRLTANLASPNTSADVVFTDAGDAGELRYNIVDGDGPEMRVGADGNLTITGNFISGATTLTVPDYVFAADYDLMPLSEVRAFIDMNNHLPAVPSAAEVQAGGLDLTQMQLTLLKKVEELTLYTLAQEDKIARLEERLQNAD